ncbi:sulfite exporter TauE/SafE family protein [Paracoccus xiamenensis]|uniref:sulfite exporter TauE/SafE family protein n=1 Tax=Paracoccus xiamenensis TaxID=2714901 RepID=UPI0014074DF4|nr:sulfite exporter TauE/SafE family protein [Paracoccus xiamenensis]NHF74379.1 sulfite exporter TauE/SafE family protein [Paracoccus xiamenensis]
MPDPGLIIFWLIAGMGAWIQSTTGFALGLILMGVTGALGLMPVPQAAAITSMLVILHGSFVLRRSLREVDREALLLVLMGAVPSLVAGFFLLNWLAGSALGVLQLLLGLVIAGAAVQLAARPTQRATRSKPLTFFLSGLAGGVMGGMFSTTGPPVIWHLYRQPMPLFAVRATLLLLFFVTQILRSGLVISTGGFDRGLLISAAGAAPAVLLGTWVARRFPSPFEPATIRKFALALLFLSGISLIVSAIGKLG